MTNEEKRELTLRQLMEDNFTVARRYRGFKETMQDASLKYYFQNLASRRSQFAIELGEEISFYGGKLPYIPSTYPQRKREENCQENMVKCIKKALKSEKASLLNYQEALCRICEGSCREVLIRHKAFIENCIFELKALKSLLKYREPEEISLREVSSHS